MGPNPFLGVIFHWIGGFCSATNFIPFRGIKRWSWEVYWIIQGVAAWLIAPTVLACIFVPHPFAILQAAHLASVGNIFWPMFWGLLWGVGGLTFGLAIRYLGLGLGYAIALGFCTGFGTHHSADLLRPVARHYARVVRAGDADGRRCFRSSPSA